VAGYLGSLQDCFSIVPIPRDEWIDATVEEDLYEQRIYTQLYV
jgi:hypothetical protein